MLNVFQKEKVYLTSFAFIPFEEQSVSLEGSSATGVLKKMLLLQDFNRHN